MVGTEFLHIILKKFRLKRVDVDVDKDDEDAVVNVDVVIIDDYFLNFKHF
jgi:hypothetical protein